MSGNQDSQNGSKSSDAATAAPRGALPRWLLVAAPAVALLIGIGLGALVVGVGGEGGSDDSDGDPSPTTSASAASSPGDVAVIVPAECQEAAQTVQEATTLIRDSVAALRDFQTGEMRTFLNQLEDLDAQAREQAQACAQVDTTTVAPNPSEATDNPSE